MVLETKATPDFNHISKKAIAFEYGELCFKNRSLKRIILEAFKKHSFLKLKITSDKRYTHDSTPKSKI